MDIPPYLSRESPKFDKIWYTNANFDKPKKHDKSEINIKRVNIFFLNY